MLASDRDAMTFDWLFCLHDQPDSEIATKDTIVYRLIGIKSNLYYFNSRIRIVSVS